MRKLFLISAALILASCQSNGTNDDSYSSEKGQYPTSETEVCGTIAGLICANDADYCHFETGVCTQISDAQGECRPKPQACTRDFRPVCGCDGKTYSNECGAHAAGVSVAATGECATEN